MGLDRQSTARRLLRRILEGGHRRRAIFTGTLIFKEGEMKEWIVGVTGLAVVAVSATMAAPASAESKTKKVDEITCEDFLALNPNDQQRIAYWVDGYAQAKNEAA